MAKPGKKAKLSNAELSNKPPGLFKRVHKSGSRKKYSKGEHETETMGSKHWIQ